MRDAGEDWRRFAADRIPSKDATPQLDRFLAAVRHAAVQPELTLLDVGCGTGRLGRRLCDGGWAVTGVDINPEAIRRARELIPARDERGRMLAFVEADFAAEQAPRIDGGPFDVVVCQLVLSIIGAAEHRRHLLGHIRDNLRRGGRLYLSASGVSDTINPGYARLYAEDERLTGERHTYFSRDERGAILYMTHHFAPDELTGLLESSGFGDIVVETVREASSRRPDEAAYFLYATCRRP